MLLRAEVEKVRAAELEAYEELRACPSQALVAESARAHSYFSISEVQKSYEKTYQFWLPTFWQLIVPALYSRFCSVKKCPLHSI